MSEPHAFDAFLRDTVYVDWDRSPLDGDASARRYHRLHGNGGTVILMQDSDAATMRRFHDIALWLRDRGLCAPEILKLDMDAGFMLLEDLGPTHIAGWISQTPGDALILYKTATDALIALDPISPPQDVPVMTPAVGGAMLDVTCDWYAKTPADQTLRNEMTHHLATLCGPPDTLALRDYHAENLIWRPHAKGLHRIGLLDFQDAFVAPRGYDLVSLTRDVRRKVAPDLASAMTTHFAKGVGTTSNALAPGLATLAVQRNLRILGVFSRLARRDGKTLYVKMIPHLWEMITADLTHPALPQLKAAVAASLPPPAHSAIKDLL